ncbi:hypothetical protein K2173_023828 [Erythroxylum novogranatense]|uniref:Zinc finger CCCH domain-containing protein 18-like n=1 Tax=Erythroxylum novogranatense TaxID=1862640 RepID=A0AAV8TI97_9ROSI|nr:hypothetical protein K2173_023828 [Erythroxylum novogranatense]
MDFPEPIKVVFNRIKKLEPEMANKIIGYLLIQECSDLEMFNLAISADDVIQELILKAKTELCMGPKALSPTIPPSMNLPPAREVLPFDIFPPVASQSFGSYQMPTHYWESQVAAKVNLDITPLSYPDSITELCKQAPLSILEDQLESVSLDSTVFPEHYFHSDAAIHNLGGQTGPRYSCLKEFPVKTCHYFNKGYCKHGSNCRYFHGQISESFPLKFDAVNDDQVLCSGSLEKLEMEIRELLKSKKGNPVSIASLPMMYYEKYGKVLQGEGYLTESQRHGRAGYSLTKLLARLKNSIRLIDRPHGQHAVILAEDAPKYVNNLGDRNDPGPIVSGSHQIYLTFPAESTFTEDDVSNYFSTFGPVEDVRIPCQQKRMFGFVTFESADTVKVVLAKGNPHFVCSARVLVKPYREKTKLLERKYHERIEHPMYYSAYETPGLLSKQLLEEQDQAFELERRRLAKLQMVQKPTADPSYFDYSMDGLKISEASLNIVLEIDFNLPSAERFGYILNALNTGSANDDKTKIVDSNYIDQDSCQGINLPESPFASAIVSSISTVI